MTKFKVHIMDWDYKISETIYIECSHSEILTKARVILEKAMEQDYGNTMQCHVSGKWPNEEKLFFIIFP